MTDIQGVCDTIYGEVASFYASRAARMEQAAGYDILYGPPVMHPDMVFLGYQPGGSEKDVAPEIERGERLPIPSQCAYAYATWTLARRMREIWSVPVLAQCTGLNANFFRARSASAWNQVRAELRREMESFSLTRAELLVRTMAPRRIVAIGLKTFRRLNEGPETLAVRRKRGALVVQGEIWGIPAVGVIHLSGARIRSDEMVTMRSHFAGPG